MKLKLFVVSILFLTSWSIQSQSTYDYFSRPGLTITSQHHNYFDGTFNNTYRFIGDTLLCDENLLIYQRASLNSYKVLLRVEGGKVWAQSYTNPCNNERLLFNFDLIVGDTLAGNLGLSVVDVGILTLLNGEKRKRISIANNSNSFSFDWIEGIGNLESGIFPIPDFEGYTALVCVKEHDETIWLSPNQSTEICDSISCSTPIPDFEFEVDQYQVKFKNLSKNQTSVHWDFGDGESSTDLHPSRNYKNSGCYNVTLTISTNCLSRTFKKQLTVPICIAQDWQVKSLDFTDRPIVVDFVTESIGWVIESTKIWKTIDGGSTWVEQYYPIPPPPVLRVFSSIDMADELNGVISLFNYSAPSSIEAFLITNDGGLNWKEKVPGSYLIISAIMTNDGQVFGSGQFDEIYYSNDWGNSFVELSADGMDFSQFQYLGNNTVVASGLEGPPPPFASKVFSISEDSGQSWTHNVLPDKYYYTAGFHFFNVNKGYVAGFEGFLIKTEDGGQTWQEIKYEDDRIANDVYFIDDQIGWAVGRDGLVLNTTDGGNTWIVGNCGSRNNLYDINALDSETCWLSSNAGKFLKLDPDSKVDCSPTNNDLNLGDVNLLIFPNPTFNEVTITFAKPNASITNNRIIISNNLGQKIYDNLMLNETLTISTKDWSSGVYWVQLFQDDQFFVAEKLIVLN